MSGTNIITLLFITSFCKILAEIPNFSRVQCILFSNLGSSSQTCCDSVHLFYDMSWIGRGVSVASMCDCVRTGYNVGDH